MANKRAKKLADPYTDFLRNKPTRAVANGFAYEGHDNSLFDFQEACVAFAAKQGRAALFLDTGMGKTLCQLEWLTQAIRASNGYGILHAPLMVGAQILKEAQRFGYANVRIIEDQSDVQPGINICNYERLHLLDASTFGAVSLDESSILKNFDGKTTSRLIAAYAQTPFRLAATATPAPNDHTELGNHAEFLGIMRRSEMLQRWFTHDSGETAIWRLKKHAEKDFWDWVSSWARMAENPSDLGFDGRAFVLEKPEVFVHKIEPVLRFGGGSFLPERFSATDIHANKRETSDARADLVANVINKEPDEPWLVWVDTDYEADALRRLLPAINEVRGSMSVDSQKKSVMDFLTAKRPHLIGKARALGFGLNFQHCARVIYMGRSFSWEAFYQTVRRVWRYGQKRRVHIHLILGEGEDQIAVSLERKNDFNIVMKKAMADAAQRDRRSISVVSQVYDPQSESELPSWL